MGASRRYNLFRRTAEPDILCAVPEDKPVPAFVAAPAWEYGGNINRASATGFRTRAVSSAIRFDGFYLLHRSRAVGAVLQGEH
jgi:hypothetical protein